MDYRAVTRHDVPNAPADAGAVWGTLLVAPTRKARCPAETQPWRNAKCPLACRRSSAELGGRTEPRQDL
jgi:hypothetical protein